MVSRPDTLGPPRPDRPASREERELWGGKVRVALCLVWLLLALVEGGVPRWMWGFLAIYTLSGFVVLWLVQRRALSSVRQLFALVMDVALLTAAIRCVGATLSFLPAIYVLVVVGFSLMAGRTIGAVALIAALLSYGGILYAEAVGFVLPSVGAGPSAGRGPYAPLMAFFVLGATCGGVYFLLAVSIKRIEKYAEVERQLIEAERIARSQNERLSQQLEQAKRLEGIGRLAGGVAHEFNNLLTVILGYSRFVSDELPENSPLRDDIREVVGSAERAATLTSQLLTFGRKQMFRKRMVNLSSVVGAHGRRLAGELPRSVQLEVKLPTSEISAHVDPSSLDAMIDGLVSNAVEAMPQGGKLELRLFRSVIGAGDRVDATGLWGECAIIEVSDTGLGMDEKVRAHLFEPFFTTKTPSAGRGMSLATIYGAARQHGGSVEAESEPGVGSTFRVILPIAADQTMAGRPSVSSTPPRPVTVLLVEDEELVRRVTARILTKAGYVVHQAADVDSALSLIETDAADMELVVTDIVMPGRSGIDLARQLHEKWPTLPVLFVSGYTDQQFAKLEEPGCGPTSFLSKPFSEDALLHEIRVLLGRASEGGSGTVRS